MSDKFTVGHSEYTPNNFFGGVSLPQGPGGVGVPPGGNAGQALIKKSNKDFDTEWGNVSGGSGGTVKWFNDIAARDAYYTENPEQLIEGISVGIGNPVTAYTFDGMQWLPGALAFKNDPPMHTHTQNIAASTWTIPHNLNHRHVNVQIVDNAGNTIKCDVDYTSANIVTLSFSIPLAGTAIIRL